MKAFVKIILLGAVLFASRISVADSGLGKDIPITVTIASSVQEQISKLPAEEKKRADKALKVGAAFMQQYLDGLVCDTENQFWDEEVGGLVAKDSYNWGEVFCGQETANWNQKDRPQVCSQSSLIALQFEKGGVSLKYQTVQLGTLSYESSGPHEFKPQGSGKTRQLIMMINADNRVSDITPKGWPDEIAYGRSLNDMKFDVANTEKFLIHPTPIVGETMASIKVKYDRYKKLIEQIEQQAAQECK